MATSLLHFPAAPYLAIPAAVRFRSTSDRQSPRRSPDCRGYRRDLWFELPHQISNLGTEVPEKKIPAAPRAVSAPVCPASRSELDRWFSRSDCSSSQWLRRRLRSRMDQSLECLHSHAP